MGLSIDLGLQRQRYTHSQLGGVRLRLGVVTTVADAHTVEVAVPTVVVGEPPGIPLPRRRSEDAISNAGRDCRQHLVEPLTFLIGPCVSEPLLAIALDQPVVRRRLGLPRGLHRTFGIHTELQCRSVDERIVVEAVVLFTFA